MQEKSKHKSLLLRIVFALNILTLLLLCTSAYSAYLSPISFPYLSNSGLAFPFIFLAAAVFAVLWLLLSKWKYHSFFWLTMLIILPSLKAYYPINFFDKTPPEGAIKLLSYNVMNFNNLQKTGDGKSDIIQYIKEQNADIVCLQEYASSTNSKYVTEKDVLKAFKAYPYRSINRVGNKNSYNRVACFSKFPILKAERINYKSQYNGSYAYKVKVKNDTVLIVNNHFESNKITQEDRKVYEKLLKLEESDNLLHGTKGLLNKIIDASLIRDKQAQAVEHFIVKNPYKYTIVCGDFNDSPLSRVNHILTKHLNNAYTESGFGMGISYNRNMFYFRIDNILISKNIKAYDCYVDNSIKYSDHYPISCFLALN